MATIGGSTSADQRDEGNTSALVRRLVRTTLTKKGAVRVDEQDVDRVFRYALRVVGSSLHASVEPDENAVADAVRLRLSRQGKPGSSSGVEFAELHSRLAQQPGLTQRWALLHTLLRVAETGSSESKRGGGTERGPDAAAAAMLANPMSASSLAGGLPALTPRTPTQAARARSANAVSVVDAADSIDTARGLAAGDGSTLGVEHPSARQLAHKELAAESLANLETAEQALVRDVLFACQGIDGVFIKYSGTQDAFVLNEDTHCSPGQRRLTEQLSECGWLFKRIRASLSDAGELNGDESSIDESPEGTLQLDTRGSDQGSTRQAFRAAIRAELAEYYRLIAVLEAQAQVPMASALAAAAANDSSNSNSNSSSSSYLSLRRLSVWLAEPQRRLRLLAVLVDATRHKKGGALLRALHEHGKHGDPAVVCVVERLLTQASVPVLNFTKQWVLTGELDDPRDEFFIRHDRTVQEDNLWRLGYEVDLEMLPPFIDLGLAHDALRAGKSINFLRRRCGDDQAWHQEKAPILVACHTAGGLIYGNQAALGVLVKEAKTRIDKVLKKVLFEKYKLHEHLNAAKRFLLLGQGTYCAFHQIPPPCLLIQD